MIPKLAFACLVATLSLLPSLARAAEPPQRLNFILILVDDMGWLDLSCQGSKFYQTPNIDRLASQGMRFTQAYSACTVCSPTRASLLTGKYPARLHITDWIAGHKKPKARLKVPDWTMYLPHEEVTFAKALKPAGYASASIGKWHLGGPDYFPDKHGFDLNIGGYDRGQPPTYVSPYKIPTLKDGPPGEFLTDRECAEAMTFIEANKDKPFLVYMPHYAVHTPIAGKKDVIEKYKSKVVPDAPQRNAIYAALVESVDDSVGRLMQKLDDLKLADRTVIIFTSDNGGLIPVTSQPPLRAGKGSSYEGGVRVPFIVRWPGAIKPGSTCDVPVISADIHPTLVELAGLAPRPGQVIDGASLVPLFKQTGPLQRDAIYWHYPHYHPGGATPYGAIRAGDLKLIEFYEDMHVELYNLKDDIGEKNDLAKSMPEKAAELRARLQKWRAETGAQMPTANPDYDPKYVDPRTRKQPATPPAE